MENVCKKLRIIFGKSPYYFSDFYMIWVIVALLILAGTFAVFGLWNISKMIFVLDLAVFIVLIVIKPMNAVYGLIGTSGNISKFILLVIIFNVLFSLIYYGGFLKNAGITYDINQPYISYGMFKNTPKDSTMISFESCNIVKGATAESKSYHISQKQLKTGNIQNDTIVFFSPSVPTEHYFSEEHIYNKITWPTVFQNTLLTSLMQEPTDLFSCCSVYHNINSPQEQNLNGFNDEESCRFFTWILLVQVFISWIFFGVFISILYNKFRYES